MNGRLAVCMALLCLTACQDHHGTPVDAYRRGGDRIAILTGLAALHAVWPCTHKYKVVGQVAAYTEMPDDECYRLDPPRRWRGLLSRGDDVEQFCPEPATTCSYDTTRDRTWIYWKTADVLKALRHLPGSGLFRVELIGRKTSVKGRYGYGDYSNEIVVDRVISITQIGKARSPEQTTLR